MRLLLGILAPLKVLGGLYLGWGIGANDSAKIFAPAIATNSIRFRTAITLICVFVIAGALAQGHTLYEKYKFDDAPLSPEAILREATIATTAAAFAVMVSTILGIPVSTSQSAVGALIGVTIARSGVSSVDFSLLKKMLVCWLATPPIGIIMAYVLYRLLAPLLPRFLPNFRVRSRFLQLGLIVFGCYEAFALGANNVVVTTAPFYQGGMFGPPGPDAVEARVLAAGLGGLAIALGAITFAKRVMETFGRKVTVLDPFSAWIVAITTGTTMEVFTLMHVPVSITQAGVGALIGVGLTKGVGGVSFGTLKKIALAWVISPLLAGILAWLGALVFAG